MKLLILPGGSIKNKEWAMEAASFLKNDFDVTIHEWKHWEIGNNEDLSFEEEAKKIKAATTSEGIYVLAKSIGTTVFAYTFPQLEIKVEKLILCGVPLTDLNDEEKDYYKSLTPFNRDNALAFQNTNDNHGSFQQARIFFDSLPLNIPIEERHRDDHHYPFYDDFKKFLTSGN